MLICCLPNHTRQGVCTRNPPRVNLMWGLGSGRALLPRWVGSLRDLRAQVLELFPPFSVSKAASYVNIEGSVQPRQTCHWIAAFCQRARLALSQRFVKQWWMYFIGFSMEDTPAFPQCPVFLNEGCCLLLFRKKQDPKIGVSNVLYSEC